MSKRQEYIRWGSQYQWWRLNYSKCFLISYFFLPFFLCVLRFFQKHTHTHAPTHAHTHTSTNTNASHKHTLAYTSTRTHVHMFLYSNPKNITNLASIGIQKSFNLSLRIVLSFHLYIFLVIRRNKIDQN